jgi:hypothetical protein
MSSQVESAQTEKASGVRLSPSEGLVPANILRLHVAFDVAPDVELAASSARLLDASGVEIPHAFLDLPGGLWSADGRTLTLILHPGRIKSGLAGCLDVGPAVTAGRRYSVEIDGGGGPVRLPLVVGPAVASPIDPSLWRIGSVRRGGRAPLTVWFDRVMDGESIAAALGVMDGESAGVDGFWRVAAGGREGVFTPSVAWTIDTAQLSLAPDLEDVAGNRPGVAFEMIIAGGSDGIEAGCRLQGLRWPSAAVGWISPRSDIRKPFDSGFRSLPSDAALRCGMSPCMPSWTQ